MWPSTRYGWALAADHVLGEPPASVHPTVWMGRGLGAVRSWHRHGPRYPARSAAIGTAALAAGVVASWLSGAAGERALARLPHSLRGVTGGLLLKPTLSLRALVDAGGEVERALRGGNLPAARRALAWHLVSRDTGSLTAIEVAGATIESLAENLGDSVVGPLLADAMGGLPAAAVYRFINTADAMLGYRTVELEWLGKAAARADDAANVIPARVAALLVALAAHTVGGSARQAARAALADARHTPSPNAGWPMAAMAGALGVRLDKRRDGGPVARARRSRGPRVLPTYLYVLNANGRAPTWRDVARARQLVRAAGVLAFAAPYAVAVPRAAAAMARRGLGGSG